MLSFCIQKQITIFIGSIVVLSGCVMAEQNLNGTLEPQPSVDSSQLETKLPHEKAVYADVISVDITGEAGQYLFSVGIESPDVDCDQYADWWEVVADDGELVYRRILLHSHAQEQPFIRSGGPVSIKPDQEILVRAHMNNSGYGGRAFKGSVKSGFDSVDLPPDFANDLAQEPPLPTDCGF
jgi:hypothetical protein